MKRGKAILEARGEIDREREHTPAEAIAAIKRVARAGFDESIEVHIRAGSTCAIRRAAARRSRFPTAAAATSVAVFAQGDAARDAQEQGPTSSAPRTSRSGGGAADFVAIRDADMMPLVGRLGRILGPQGRCPTRRVGDHDEQPQGRAEVKAGKVEYARTAHGDRAPGHRQAELQRPRAARELSGRDRGDHPGPAVSGEGALPALDHARLDWSGTSRSTLRGPATSSRRRRSSLVARGRPPGARRLSAPTPARPWRPGGPRNVNRDQKAAVIDQIAADINKANVLWSTTRDRR